MPRWLRHAALVLAVAVPLAVFGTAAAAAPSAKNPPRLSPAQATCARKALGAKTYRRLTRARRPWPAAALRKIRHCVRPKPKAPGAASCSPGTLDVAPVDLTSVTSVGLPGQVRGGDYKGHGYLRLNANDASVVLPVAATLYEGGRYLEQGEVQYLLYFRADCGLVFVFDHVAQPTPAVEAAYAGKPAPQPDDSRTYPLQPTRFAKGASIATAIGFRQTANAAVDFGAYDLSRPNAASQRPGFQGDRSTWRDANALCWLDLYVPAISQRLRALTGGSVEGGGSDVCS